MECPKCKSPVIPLEGCYCDGKKLLCCNNCGAAFESSSVLEGKKLSFPPTEDNNQKLIFPLIIIDKEVK